MLGVVYVMFALWRLIDILENELGGNTVAAEFTLFIKTRQVRGWRSSRVARGFLSLGPVLSYCTASAGGRAPFSCIGKARGRAPSAVVAVAVTVIAVVVAACVVAATLTGIFLGRERRLNPNCSFLQQR